MVEQHDQTPENVVLWERNLGRGGVATSLLSTEKYVVVTMDNAMIWVFAEDGEFLHSLGGHERGVWAASVFEDTLVSGGRDTDVRVWDLRSGQPQQLLEGHTSTIRCLAFSDAKTVISGSRDSTLRVWDLETSVCKDLLQGHTDSVRCIAVCDNLAVSGSADNSARVWNIDTGACLKTLQGHSARINQVICDGEIIVTASLDSTTRLWKINDGACVGILSSQSGSVGSLSFQNSVSVSGSSDGTLLACFLEQGRRSITRVLAGKDHTITSLCTIKDQIFAATSSDGRLFIWDIANDSCDIVSDPSSTAFDTLWQVSCCDGELLAVGRCKDEIVLRAFNIM